MRKIDTTQIVDPNVQQGFTGPSIDFLTKNSLETIASLVQYLIQQTGSAYSPTQVYVLYGCVVTGVTSGAGNFAMTAGAVFYGGEIYQIDAVSTIAVGGGNTVYSLASLNPTTLDPIDGTRPLDPQKFSDGSTKNVHITGTWITSILTTGSGSNPVSGWFRFNTTYTVGGSGVAYNTNYSDVSGSTKLNYGYRAGMIFVNGECKGTGATDNIGVFTLPIPPTTNDAGYGFAIVTDAGGTLAQGTVISVSIGASGKVVLITGGATVTNSFQVFVCIPLN